MGCAGHIRCGIRSHQASVKAIVATTLIFRVFMESACACRTQDKFYNIILRYLAAAASNRLSNSNFFSAGKNDASNEFRASSRRCSSVKP